MTPPFRWPLSMVTYALSLAAFLIPVLAAVWSWMAWHRARLTDRNVRGVEHVFRAALRESEFDEVERILESNQENLKQLPASAASVLFHPRMVAALLDSDSLVHLELLSDMQFLTSLENRFAVVDAVARQLLRSELSPLRSAVVQRYGGLEPFTPSEREQALMQRTFLNPDWYHQARADYPLVIAAVEEMRTGKLDAEYNGIGRNYEASQGISTRAHCPIYLAIKTHVLAIEAALETRFDQDLYVTDLEDIFRAVQERSRFDKAIWEHPLSNWEYPTPYAYLLHNISADLWDLSSTALRKATSDTVPRHTVAPGRLAGDLAMTWSFCVWGIADSYDQVSADFRNEVIAEYLRFVLALRSQPSEIYMGGVNEVEGITVWRDLFVKELQARFRGDSRRGALKEAMKSLDKGKGYVLLGYDWLAEQLSI